MIHNWWQFLAENSYGFPVSKIAGSTDVSKVQLESSSGETVWPVKTGKIKHISKSCSHQVIFTNFLSSNVNEVKNVALTFSR